MSWDADRLYALLPALHRIQDERRGGPLRAFTALLARELDALDGSLDQLYDDQFIETCADWVAPYIGDLIGYRPVRSDAQAGSAGLNSPRAEIANTIALRRRKGTALMLEALARNVTDWPAHATEFFEQLATSQYMKHPRLHAPATAEVRRLGRMLAIGQDAGAFGRSARTAEVRRPEGGSGRFNIPNIGLFLWRIRPMELRELPLVPDPGDATGTKFRVNPLGFDLPLFRRPLPEDGIGQLSTEANVPAPLRIRSLALQVRAAQAGADGVERTLDYGTGRSFVFRRGDAVLPVQAPGPAAAARRSARARRAGAAHRRPARHARCRRQRRRLGARGRPAAARDRDRSRARPRAARPRPGRCTAVRPAAGHLPSRQCAGVRWRRLPAHAGRRASCAAAHGRRRCRPAGTARAAARSARRRAFRHAGRCKTAADRQRQPCPAAGTARAGRHRRRCGRP
jgi:hypothetical protein